MPKPRTTALVAALALTLAACSGSSDEAAPVTLEAPGVTAAASTTEPPATDDSVATTSTTVATTSTTEAATTTTEPPAPTTTELSVEDQVRAAAVTYDEFYVECLRAPDLCDPAEVTLDGSDARGALTSTVDELVANNLFVGDEDPGRTVIESVDRMDDHTLVTVCNYTTMVLYFQPPIEGAEPTVQNDTPGTVREAWQFVQDPNDLQWKLRRGDTLSTTSGVDECPVEEP